MNPEPLIKQRKGISILWILPFIACCISIWLLYSSYQNRGVEITVSFSDASGIVAGKTRVQVKGIPIGSVTKMSPDLDLQRVQVTITIDRDIADKLVEDSQFWIVRPHLSASSVQGLDTIISGSYIGAQLGSSTVPSRKFTGLSSPPPVSPDAPGLHLQLRAEKLGSIQTGTIIYYRNVEIGTVQRYQLDGDDSILVDIFIKPQFSHLVREGSRFNNASGLEISGKLPNLKVRVESLAALLRGGILLHTPTQMEDTPLARDGYIFALYPDYESANYGIPMTLTLSSSEDIVEGATKVMYRGLEAGFVKEITINNDQRRTVTAHILLDPRAELILRAKTRFWLVKPAISAAGVNNMRLLFSGAHITFQPGEGNFTDHFEILPEPPNQPPLRSGNSFSLISEEPAELSPQSPVYFKNIQVGEVVDVNIASSGRTVLTTFFIYREYLHLLSTNSVFWIQSGVRIHASLRDGFQLSTGPMTRLLYGGISFTTPDKLNKKKNFSPEEGAQYQLYSSYSKAVAATPALQKSAKLVNIVATDAASLSPGAPILHKSIRIGEIKDFRLTKDLKKVVIECTIYDEFRSLITPRSRFYNLSGLKVSGGLTGLTVQTGSLMSMLAGGIGCINPAGAHPLPTSEPYPLYPGLEEAITSEFLEITISLHSSKGLKIGSPLHYKGVVIGKIRSLGLDKDLQTIIARARVEKRVRNLFRKNTRIWVAGPEISLAGVKNMETVIFGSFLDILPGDGPHATTFAALDKPPRTEIANRDGLGIVLNTPHLGSLSAGSPVYYRQVQIGKITGYELSPSYQTVHVHVSIENRYRSVIRKNTRFWNVSGAKIEGGLFSGLKITTGSMETIMRGGVALATPNNEETGAVASPGDHFTLHDAADKKWLDWNPDVILLELEESQGSLKKKR